MNDRIGDDTAKVLNKAVEEFGEQPQIDITIEELSELVTALSRLNRGRVDEDNIREEIADVQLCLEQMKLLFGEDEVDEIYEEKFERLKHRVETGEWL